MATILPSGVKPFSSTFTPGIGVVVAGGLEFPP